MYADTLNTGTVKINKERFMYVSYNLIFGRLYALLYPKSCCIYFQQEMVQTIFLNATNQSCNKYPCLGNEVLS